MHRAGVIVLALSFIFVVDAQLDAFSLSNGRQYAAKPTITPDIQKYFELDGHARELVDTLIGPRPGGFFPEKTYEVAAPQYTGGSTSSGGSNDGLAQVGRAIEQFFSGPPAPNPEFQLPPGFNQGFSLNNGNTQLASSQQKEKLTVIFQFPLLKIVILGR